MYAKSQPSCKRHGCSRQLIFGPSLYICNESIWWNVLNGIKPEATTPWRWQMQPGCLMCSPCWEGVSHSRLLSGRGKKQLSNKLPKKNRRGKKKRQESVDVLLIICSPHSQGWSFQHLLLTSEMVCHVDTRPLEIWEPSGSFLLGEQTAICQGGPKSDGLFQDKRLVFFL